MINQDDNKDSIEEITAQSNDDSVLNSPEIVTNSLKKNKTFNIVCILSLIWNIFILIAFCLSYFFMVATYFGLSHEDMLSVLILLFCTAICGIIIYSLLLSILGAYKMIKGDGKGYSYFMQGNGIFLVCIVLAIFGIIKDGRDFNLYHIAFFIISAIFRLIFREYKNKLMNL